MRSISMAYTTPAIVAKAKEVTRRTWKDSYAKSFEVGERLEATSRQYRFGGELVAIIEVTEKPFLEDISDWEGREDELYVKEGFAFLEAKNIISEHAPLKKLMRMWVANGGDYYVIPFKVTSVAEPMRQKYTSELEIEKARNSLFKAISGGMKIDDITPDYAYIKQVA